MTIPEILAAYKTIAVVGLSSRRTRASFGVADYMQRAGYRIIPVNPQEQDVLGERSYPDLAAVPVPVEIVDIFRRSEFVPEIVDQAIAIGAKAPATYFDELRVQVTNGTKKYGGIVDRDEMVKNLRMNCIPEAMLGGEVKSYEAFLEERRKLMALKIKTWFESLG